MLQEIPTSQFIWDNSLLSWKTIHLPNSSVFINVSFKTLCLQILIYYVTKFSKAQFGQHWKSHLQLGPKLFKYPSFDLILIWPYYSFDHISCHILLIFTQFQPHQHSCNFSNGPGILGFKLTNIFISFPHFLQVYFQTSPCCYAFACSDISDYLWSHGL